MYNLSLIIPIYNVEDYIQECLESVIVQLVPEVQVICINDGSPDTSMTIARTLVNSLPEKIKKQFLMIDQENQGLSGARNTGISVATGKYIGFLDSDDKLMPGYFKNILALVNLDTYDIIDFNIMVSNGSNIKIRKGNILELDSVFVSAHWFSCARIIKRQYFLKYNFTKGIYYEDLALTPLLYLEASKTIHIPMNLYWYRYNENGISLNSTQKANRHTIESFEIILKQYLEIYSHKPNLYYYSLLINTYFLLCVNVCRRYSYKESLKYVKTYHSLIVSLNKKRNIEFTELLSTKINYFFKHPRKYLLFYKLYCNFYKIRSKKP